MDLLDRAYVLPVTVGRESKQTFSVQVDTGSSDLVRLIQFNSIQIIISLPCLHLTPFLPSCDSFWLPFAVDIAFTYLLFLFFSG